MQLGLTERFLVFFRENRRGRRLPCRQSDRLLPLHPAYPHGDLGSTAAGPSATRACRLQLERGGLTFQVDEATVKQILEEDPPALSL
jgi:hypothetical protein